MGILTGWTCPKCKDINDFNLKECGNSKCALPSEMDKLRAKLSAAIKGLENIKKIKIRVPCPDNKEGCCVMHFGPTTGAELAETILKQIGEIK